MIRSEEHLQKIMELFEQCGLDEAAMQKIEAYMTDGGAAELSGIAEQDMGMVSPEVKRKFADVMQKAVDRHHNEEANRLFEALFAIGGVAIHDMMPFWWWNMKKSGKIQMETAKAAAIYACMIGNTESRLSRREIVELSKVAEEKAENVKQALEYTTPKQGNTRLFLYAAYFYLKYPIRQVLDTLRETEPSAGILGKVKKLFGGRQQAGLFVIAEEDRELMNRYEETILGGLGTLVGQCAQNTPDAIGRVAAELRKDSPSLKLIRDYRNLPYSSFMMKLLGGCAFANFVLSNRLRNVVTFCCALDMDGMLSVMEAFDLRLDFSQRGGNFDELFDMDLAAYISWASLHQKKNVMAYQFMNHRERFLEYYQQAEYETTVCMADVMKEKDPDFYEKLMGQDHTKQKTRDKMIELLIGQDCPPQHMPAIRDYLYGKTEIGSLYPIQDAIQVTGWYVGKDQRRALERHYAMYKDTDFYNRSFALCILRGCNGFYDEDIGRNRKGMDKALIYLFRVLDAAGMDVAHQLEGLSMIVDRFYSEEIKEALTKHAQEIFGNYLEERREETVEAFANANAYGRSLGIMALAENAGRNKEVILKYSTDSAKSVREVLLSVLQTQKDWKEDMVAMLGSKKAGDRELAARVLIAWHNPEDTDLLRGALEKEKSAKVSDLINRYLNSGKDGDGKQGTENGDAVASNDDLVKELHKGGKKRSLAWAYETPFSPVHKKDGSEAEEAYLQAVLIAYASMDRLGVNKMAAKLVEELQAQDFTVYVNELFDKWMELGAEAKKRWVLYAAAQHGGADIVAKLEHQIKEWPTNSRGAIAAEAVQALALSPEPQALLIVDGIARKFKFKQVKAAAGKALEYAAGQLGLTRAQLEDKIVPDLGFDEHMERHFDYGGRRFTVTITPALEVEVFDASGKKLKNLPAPGKKDDEEKAAAAYSEFKQMKKQMKATVSSQKMRLEMALSSERLWNSGAWQELFVKNPIMHQFAIGLIWGVYEEHRLVKSFRYMEDGSFNTEDEEEYELSEDAKIGFVHPVDLTKESLETWKEQLLDYEITQPFEQLDRPVYGKLPEEENCRQIERFGGMILNDLSLAGKLQTFGWYRGDVLDAGGFDAYYREDVELGYGATLFFSGSFVGGMGEEVTVYEAAFYRAGQVQKESYFYHRNETDHALLVKDVPDRYFSEIVLQLTRATVSSKERDERWKEAK
ncbi:MAG: DUF4132 domain-containing protein [Clostridium sp.]|nr:DUF4132 domain-containing protein [Clostridium sp.]